MAARVAGRKGRTTVKALPWPSTLSTVIAPPHLRRRLPRDRKPEPAAAVPPNHFGIRLVERFEDVGQVPRIDAGSGVAHDDAQALTPAGEFVRRDREMDGARRSELDRIAGKVEENLTEPAGIPVQSRRQVVVFDAEAQALGLCRRFDDGGHAVEQFGEVEVALVERFPPSFEPRHIENAVCQQQQHVGRGGDSGDVDALPAVQHGLPEQPREADDRVHRGPDFVAHVGEEPAPRFSHPFGRLLGEGQRRFRSPSILHFLMQRVL